METKAFDQLNVIPLVDVMLVLLTIVLTTSTFIAVGALPVQLPRAENAENSSSSRQDIITIALDADGTIHLDQQAVDDTGLRRALSTYAPTTPVVIRSDRRVVLQHFVTVMDVVKGLGFTQVNLQTELER